MTEHSHCSGYVYSSAAGTLSRRNSENSKWLWEGTLVGQQPDLSVVDIECIESVVVITTGQTLSILDAQSGELKWTYVHPSFKPGIECFSRLTLDGDRLFVNLCRFWSDNKYCSEVHAYDLSIDTNDPEEARVWSEVLDQALSLIRMPVVDGMLLVQQPSGDVLSIPVESQNKDFCPGPEGGEGCGGWRCFVP